MKKITPVMLLIVVGLTAYEYSLWTMRYENVSQAEQIVMSLTERPYVYRVLIPWIARVLTFTGLRPEQALSILVMLSAIALVYGIKSLFEVVQPNMGLRGFILSSLAVEIFMLVFFFECKVYDLATAAFFAFGIAWIAKRRHHLYYILFPFACLNRETAFLLIFLFAVYEWRKMTVLSWILSVTIQNLIFISIRLLLMDMYADNAGTVLIFRPIYNLLGFLRFPLEGVLHWSAFSTVIYLSLRNRRSNPSVLNVSFLLLLPILMVLYILFGGVFEVRVFAEVYPLAWVLCWQNSIQIHEPVSLKKGNYILDVPRGEQ